MRFLFPDAATAERAVKELDGLEVMGRQLRADHAQKKDGGGGGGRGGGGYGGKCNLSHLICLDRTTIFHQLSSHLPFEMQEVEVEAEEVETATAAATAVRQTGRSAHGEELVRTPILSLSAKQTRLQPEIFRARSR